MTRTLILWELNTIESGVECVVRDDSWWLDRDVKSRGGKNQWKELEERIIPTRSSGNNRKYINTFTIC